MNKKEIQDIKQKLLAEAEKEKINLQDLDEEDCVVVDSTETGECPSGKCNL